MKPNWLYDENGDVRKELYQLSNRELDKHQDEVLTQQSSENPPWTDELIPGADKALWPITNPALAALKMGDIIYVKQHYSVAKEFFCKMTFIAFAGVAGGLPPSKCMFCRTENGGARVCDWEIYPSDRIWHASARQRSKSYVRMKGLWKEATSPSQPASSNPDQGQR